MPTTNYIWDEQNILAETDVNNVVQTVYTNEPHQYGNLVSSRISATTSHHHFDALGSTRQLTNSAGSTTDTMIYESWGNVVNRTGTTAANLLWIGELGYYSDPEIGQFHVRRRPYNPVIARWTTVDPLRHDAGSMNLYVYVNGRPTALVDPTGLLMIASGPYSVREAICGFDDGYSVWSETIGCPSGSAAACCASRATGWGWGTAWTVLAAQLKITTVPGYAPSSPLGPIGGIGGVNTTLPPVVTRPAVTPVDAAINVALVIGLVTIAWIWPRPKPEPKPDSKPAPKPKPDCPPDPKEQTKRECIQTCIDYYSDCILPMWRCGQCNDVCRANCHENSGHDHPWPATDRFGRPCT